MTKEVCLRKPRAPRHGVLRLLNPDRGQDSPLSIAARLGQPRRLLEPIRESHPWRSMEFSQCRHFSIFQFMDIGPEVLQTRYIGRDYVNLEALGGKRSISSVADDPGALSISMETPVSGLFGPGKSGPASIIPLPAPAFHNANDDPSISAGEFILACPPRDSSPGVEMLIKRRAPLPSGCRADSSP